jgi:hypothetical protein
MNMNKTEKILIESIEKDEFYHFLIGYGDYKIEMDQWVSANMPTNTSKILSDGVYKLYISRPDLTLDKRLFEELHRMLGMDIFNLYMVLDIVFSQLLNESYGVAPFSLDSAIVDCLSESLIKNQDLLKKYKEWQGMGKENGVWDEVIRIDKIIFDKTGRNII